MRWIERQRNYLDFTLSSLARRWAKNLMLLVTFGLVVFLVASVAFFAQGLKHAAMTMLADAPQMVVQRMVAGRHDFIPEPLADELAAIRGVRRAEKRLWGYYFHQAAGANYTVMARPDIPDGEAVIGNGVLRTWPDAAVGQKIFFKGADGAPLALKISGALAPDTELVTSDLILISESTFRRLFNIRWGLATDLALTVRNTTECPVIAEKIVREHPELRVVLREEMQRTYASVFDWRNGYVTVLLSGALLAFLIFAWDKATGLSAEERAEIGILKAVGWDTADVLAVKFWEGLAISLSAFLLGTVAAYAHVFLAPAPLFEHALKGWAVLYPRFQLAPAVDAAQVLSLFFFTVLPYTVVTILPVWSAASTDPDRVMRHV